MLTYKGDPVRLRCLRPVDQKSVKWLTEKALQFFKEKSFDQCQERLQEVLNVSEAVLLVEEGDRKAGVETSLHSPGHRGSAFRSHQGP